MLFWTSNGYFVVAYTGLIPHEWSYLWLHFGILWHWNALKDKKFFAHFLVWMQLNSIHTFSSGWLGLIYSMRMRYAESCCSFDFIWLAWPSILNNFGCGFTMTARRLTSLCCLRLFWTLLQVVFFVKLFSSCFRRQRLFDVIDFAPGQHGDLDLAWPGYHEKRRSEFARNKSPSCNHSEFDHLIHPDSWWNNCHE